MVDRARLRCRAGERLQWPERPPRRRVGREARRGEQEGAQGEADRHGGFSRGWACWQSPEYTPSRPRGPYLPPRSGYNGGTDRIPPPEPRIKSHPQVIDGLNRALTIELTAINSYLVQSKMCKNWGFLKLAKKHYQESIGEMAHADTIIAPRSTSNG